MEVGLTLAEPERNGWWPGGGVEPTGAATLPRLARPATARSSSRRLPRLAFRFHDLRHYAVSQLIAQGASILQVARVAGHADPSVTLRVYGHLLAGGLVEAARRYDPLRALGVDER
jgi:integrase